MPAWSTDIALGPPAEGQVMRRCGRFRLTRSPQGFWWLFTSEGGSVWYWQADARQWVGDCHVYYTEEEATAGLDETLTHERTGDLDEQHAAPPTVRGSGTTLTHPEHSRERQ